MSGVSRRGFLAATGVGLTATSFAMSKSPILRPGDQVAAIGPAGRLEPDFIQALLGNLRSLGLEPVLGPNAERRHQFFAGTDEQRASDLNEAIRNPKIRAISCLRGGWGCARILPLIDWSAWRADPKPVIGFSDITALLVAAMGHKVPLGFHGSQAPPPEKPLSTASFRRALMETGPYHIFASGGESPPLAVDRASSDPVRGRLIGGNLMVLNQLIGTGYLPSFKDKILFLEDVNEAPYRIDRMLTQMHMAGVFKGVRAVLLGQFTKCDDPDSTDVPTAMEVLREQLGKLNVPIVSNIQFGHIREQLMLPVGAEVTLNTGSQPELWWHR
ncbi:MAG: LD-carboxypeptidase [Chthonomonas sp.]|nr:LD-carboxypeptidase [Chthonomonas sp.]